MNRRRKLLIALALAGLVPPVWAQPKMPRVGFFYFGSRQSAMELGRFNLFLQGMREQGYEDGRNFVLVPRFADSSAANADRLAVEFVRAKVDVIVATGAPVYDALKKVQAGIPTVVTVASAPVAMGLAQSLARPGGNFTGLSENNADLVTKHIELLRLAVPNLARIAVLTNHTNPATAYQLKLIESALRQLGLGLLALESSTTQGNEQAFAAIARERIEGLVILNDTFFVQQSRQLATLAIKHRVASIFGTQDYARAGGLMSYGPEIGEQFRRAAIYVDKILKGAKAGDLPMEQPTVYLLTVNKKTAKAIGRTLPSELLFRADKVIE